MADEMNGMIEFFYQFSDGHPAISIRMSPAAALPEVLQTFEQFLRGAGYYFDGQIDIVRFETVQQDENAELN